MPFGLSSFQMECSVIHEWNVVRPRYQILIRVNWYKHQKNDVPFTECLWVFDSRVGVTGGACQIIKRVLDHASCVNFFFISLMGQVTIVAGTGGNSWGYTRLYGGNVKRNAHRLLLRVCRVWSSSTLCFIGDSRLRAIEIQYTLQASNEGKHLLGEGRNGTFKFEKLRKTNKVVLRIPSGHWCCWSKACDCISLVASCRRLRRSEFWKQSKFKSCSSGIFRQRQSDNLIWFNPCVCVFWSKNRW